MAEIRWAGCWMVVFLSGCHIVPEIAHQPMIHNPFPQLGKVAVAPFFNLSTDPSVNGREFAAAYFNELQQIPGFEVVPVGVVEQVMRENAIDLSSPADARRLAKLLDVDAVVIGAVTEFTPFYPPRCGLRVEWYAHNPCFHPVPVGYGLPWGTTEEEYIPDRLRLEAELEQAKVIAEELSPAPPVEVSGTPGDQEATAAAASIKPVSANSSATGPLAETVLPPPGGNEPCWPTDEPVLRHTSVYNGHDNDVVEALKSYTSFQKDDRPGEWHAYLQRSHDFIRFCCRMHLYEMLTARGGADQTRVVFRMRPSR